MSLTSLCQKVSFRNPFSIFSLLGGKVQPCLDYLIFPKMIMIAFNNLYNWFSSVNNTTASWLSEINDTLSFMEIPYNLTQQSRWQCSVRHCIAGKERSTYSSCIWCDRYMWQAQLQQNFCFYNFCFGLCKRESKVRSLDSYFQLLQN